jgi:glycosyltransferase involved in cell wall biosynthesis
MRVFDSNVDGKWSGRGFSINGNSLTMGKSASSEHFIFIEKGKHKFKIIGKKRTGNGKLNIAVIAEDGNILLEKSVSFTKSSWTEFSFAFESKLNYGRGKVILSRPRRVFGSIEVGRVLLEKEVEKIVEAPMPAPEKFQRPKNARAKRLERMPREMAKPHKVHVPPPVPPNFKRRVAFVIPYPIFGGAEVYLREIISRMDTDLYDITMLYMGKNILRSHLDDVSLSNRVCRNLQQLSGVLISEQFDSVVFYNRLDIYKTISDLRSKGKIHSRVYEVYHSDFVWSGAVSKLKKRSGVDVIFRVAKSLAEDIKGVSSDNKITVPVGIDLNKFHVRWEDEIPHKIRRALQIEDAPVIGTVARLSKEKNIDYVLDLAKELAGFQFMILGSGPKQGALLKRVEDEGITNVNFLGFVKNPEMYYNMFDGFVLASDMEGTPISILEAMASGVVVFSNMVGAIPDILEDNVTGFRITGDPKVDADIVKENVFNLDVVNKARDFVEENHDIDKNAKIFVDKLLGIGDFHVENKYPERIVLEGEFI